MKKKIIYILLIFVFLFSLTSHAKTNTYKIYVACSNTDTSTMKRFEYSVKEAFRKSTFFYFINKEHNTNFVLYLVPLENSHGIAYSATLTVKIKDKYLYLDSLVGTTNENVFDKTSINLVIFAEEAISINMNYIIDNLADILDLDETRKPTL